jgi:putative PIN family toxin of toxin-antitoxin system
MAVASSGALRELADAWLLERRITALSSEQILDEVERALAKPYFAKRTSADDRRSYLALLRRETIVVTSRTRVRGAASDPDDDAVLAAAVDGEARYLVTGDRRLRELAAFRGVEIVTARELLDLVEAATNDL